MGSSGVVLRTSSPVVTEMTRYTAVMVMIFWMAGMEMISSMEKMAMITWVAEKGMMCWMVGTERIFCGVQTGTTFCGVETESTFCMEMIRLSLEGMTFLREGLKTISSWVVVETIGWMVGLGLITWREMQGTTHMSLMVTSLLKE